MNFVVPLLSTIVSLGFAVAVLVQYASRRRPHQLVWGIGLVCFAIASFARFLVGLEVWNDTVYRVWYLFGAYFAAAYLGMGTIYLLANRRAAHWIMAILAIASLLAIVLIFTATVDLAQLPRYTLKAAALPTFLRIITAVFNTFGAGALVIGAAYSAWVLWRRGSMPERVLSNVLVAVGGLLPTAGGSLMAVGMQDPSALLELLGILVIFLGFLANYEVISSRFAWTPKPAA